MGRLLSTRKIAARIRGRSAYAAAKSNVRSLEAIYTARILALLGAYRETVEKSLFGILEYIGAPQAPKFDDPSDIIERTFAGLRVVVAQFFDKKRLQRIPAEMAFEIDKTNRTQFKRMVKTVLKVDPLLSEPWLMDSVNSFVKQNVSLIRSIPSDSLNEIEHMLYRDAQRKLSPQEMKKKIIERFEVAESRAELIAIDQVLKFNGSLTELRQRGIGVKQFVWRSSEDQRVRPLHQALNGNTYSWDDLPVSGTNGERLPPGMPIRCRCYAEPVLDDLLK